MIIDYLNPFLEFLAVLCLIVGSAVLAGAIVAWRITREFRK